MNNKILGAFIVYVAVMIASVIIGFAQALQALRATGILILPWQTTGGIIGFCMLGILVFAFLLTMIIAGIAMIFGEGGDND